MRCEYDRGTIVLHDLPPEVAHGLPLTWDDRIAAHRAVSSDWPALRHLLAERCVAACLPARFDPLAVELRAPELRAYQQAALDTWVACGRRGVVVLPTGAGKTRVALAAIASLGLATLVLVPTRVLQSQWVEALGTLGAGTIGQLGDGHRQVEPLTVATYESAWRRAAGLGDRFALLVVDEAHHAGGILRAECLETSLAPFRLGLTALSPGASSSSSLERLVGPVVFALHVRDLAGTSLAPVQLVGVGLCFTPEEHARWMGDMATYMAERSRQHLELVGKPWSDVVRTLARTAEGRRALAARARAVALASFTTGKALVLAAILGRHAGERTIVFTRDNATAYAISRTHLVPALTCEVRSAERRAILGAFARGDIRVVVSARVLDEGLDVPEASVAAIVGAGGAERQHVQRVGRILRPGAGKRAVVYDLFNLQTHEAFAASRRRKSLAS